ncbi:DUF2871 domain-containing protein [Proteiniclasticum ruminis]|uniref:Beta-carotene 15,15'-monooxygenase n=1 Tax=Proteiniclasticum ruminis TaxID=398199 RepID=A0A1I4YWB6_9CLOT|nr:DUF2871 domain-containing protein [Proteiniclasticum ruminis]SFN42315.1 Protein of unknown function [Proteiniclasticum ruminis]
MGLFESIFDLSYLILVIGFGVRLLLLKDKGAKLFGLMGVLLGAGDAFHLIPRVISHLSEGGFEANATALSWGQFVTSLTMTLFYLLYYYYYKRQTQKGTKLKDILVYVLVLGRIILVLLPQNEWGSIPGNYTFGILRNIPFALLGLLLIKWSWDERTKDGMKHMAVLIFFSFILYAPVVLWAQAYPWVGAFMMPKTVAYLLLVYVGFKHYVKEFRVQSLIELSFASLILGLVGGVFYREFTKVYGFTDSTYLGKVHVHALVLGFLSLLVFYSIVSRSNKKDLTKSLRRPIYLWVSGLLLSIVMMMIHGIIEVTGNYYGSAPEAAISGIAGMGHILLSVGIVWSMLILSREDVKNS